MASCFYDYLKNSNSSICSFHWSFITTLELGRTNVTTLILKIKKLNPKKICLTDSRERSQHFNTRLSTHAFLKKQEI